MLNTSKTAFLALLLMCTGACATEQGTLVFGTSDTLGLSVAGSAGETGAQITLGFREQNVAWQPVYVRKPDGTVELLGGNDAQLAENVDGASDTYTVFGHFGLRTETEHPNVTLGRFFATGMAARDLGRGFGCREAAEGYRGTGAALSTNPADCMAGRVSTHGDPAAQPDSSN